MMPARPGLAAPITPTGLPLLDRVTLKIARARIEATKLVKNRMAGGMAVTGGGGGADGAVRGGGGGVKNAGVVVLAGRDAGNDAQADEAAGRGRHRSERGTNAKKGGGGAPPPPLPPPLLSPPPPEP